MKKIIYTMVLLLGTIAAGAQLPQGFSYQAVARNGEGAILPNQAIAIRFTIRDESASGNLLYQEYHQLTTNPLGLFQTTIGKGTTTVGNFESIPWGNGKEKYLEVELDPNGGSSFTVMGAHPMWSVPFALMAKETTSPPELVLDQLTDVDADMPNVGQVLKWNGSSWAPATDETGSGTAYTAGSGININGTVISNTGDADPSDDLTVSSTAGGDLNGSFSNLQIANGAVGTTEIADGAVIGAKIAQQGAMNNQVLKWAGSSWIPAEDNWGSQFIQTDNSLSGNGLLSTPLKLAQQGATNNQVLKWSGSNWTPAEDNWGSQFVQTDGSLTGNGLLSTPLKLAQQGAASNQVLKWSGSNWTPAEDNWGSQFVQTDGTFTGNGLLSTPLKLAQQNAAVGQVLKWNGTSWSPQNDVGGGNGDNWGTQAVVTNSSLAGNGTFGNPLKIASQGATSGQALKWNGSDWMPGEDNTLSIPFAASAMATTALFDITNMGVGDALKGTAQDGIFTAGVRGISTVNGGNGVIGEADNGSTAFGIWGKSVAGTGVYGIGGNFGVKGLANGSGTGGYFQSENGLALATGNGKVGIGSSSNIGGKMEIKSKGTFGNPQLLLREETVDSFARIGFRNVNVPDRSWSLGGRITSPDNLSDWFNLYYQSGNDTVSFLTMYKYKDFPLNPGWVEVDGSIKSKSLYVRGDLARLELRKDGSGANIWDIEIEEGDLVLWSGYNPFDPVGTFNKQDGTYYHVSDGRLKHDVVEMSGILPAVAQLRPVTYQVLNSTRRSIGFIAQEVEPLFPELVSQVKNKNDESVYQMNYEGFGTIAIKAIQEQQQMIETQQARIDALEKKVNELAGALQALMSQK